MPINSNKNKNKPPPHTLLPRPLDALPSLLTRFGCLIALRLFDPATGACSVYWVSGRDGLLGVPVVGTFEGPGCVFEGEDTDGGQPIQQRYIWSRTDTHAPRWEQAYSYDGGRTWELNWVMDWTRIE